MLTAARGRARQLRGLRSVGLFASRSDAPWTQIREARRRTCASVPLASTAKRKDGEAGPLTGLRGFLERHGDWIVTFANVVQLSGFSCSDTLMLQSLMIVGNGSMAVFFVTRMPAMGVPFIWAFLKAVVNVVMVIKILRSRQPVVLTEEELDAYEEHFMPFGVTARQFKELWELGSVRVLQHKETLLVEGQPVDRVFLVTSGHVWRTCGGARLPHLDSFPEARRIKPDGDAGAWVGELSFLRMMDSAKVAVAEDRTVSHQLLQRQMERELEQHLHPKEGDSWSSIADLDHVPREAEAAVPEALRAHVERNASKHTVYADTGSVVRYWSTPVLLFRTGVDSDLRGMLRKAFAQSAVKKAMVTFEVAGKQHSIVEFPAELNAFAEAEANAVEDPAAKHYGEAPRTNTMARVPSSGFDAEYVPLEGAPSVPMRPSRSRTRMPSSGRDTDGKAEAEAHLTLCRY